MDWFTPLYLLAVYGLVRFFVRAKTDNQKSGWTPLESVTVTLFIYFAAQLLGGTLVFLLPLLGGLNSEQAVDWLGDNAYGQFALVAAISILTTWFLKGFLKRRQSSFRSIGLGNRKPRWGDLGYVMIGFVIYFVAFIVITTIVKQLVPALDLDQEQQIGFKNPTNLQLPLVFISLVLLPAFVEETLVRGFLYTGLKKGLNKVWAILIASSLFAIAHLQAGSGEPLLWIAALDTFVLSIVLIYLKNKTGSLWAPIGLHIAKNGLAFSVLFIFATN